MRDECVCRGRSTSVLCAVNTRAHCESRFLPRTCPPCHPTVVLSVHLFVSVSVSKAKSPPLGRNPRFVHPRERLFCLNMYDVGLQTKSVRRDPKRLFNKDNGLDIPETFLFPRGWAECKTWSGNLRYAHSSATSVRVTRLRIQRAPPCFRRCDALI